MNTNKNLDDIRHLNQNQQTFNMNNFELQFKDKNDNLLTSHSIVNEYITSNRYDILIKCLTRSIQELQNKKINLSDIHKINVFNPLN